MGWGVWLLPVFIFFIDARIFWISVLYPYIKKRKIKRVNIVLAVSYYLVS